MLIIWRRVFDKEHGETRWFMDGFRATLNLLTSLLVPPPDTTVQSARAKNTFSVTDDGHQRKWYCFHADCNVKGYTGVTLTKEYAKRASILQRTSQDVETKPTEVVPDTFVSVGRNVDAELYLRKYGAYDAYLSGNADIQWDFKRGRVVFMVQGTKVRL